MAEHERNEIVFEITERIGVIKPCLLYTSRLRTYQAPI